MGYLNNWLRHLPEKFHKTSISTKQFKNKFIKTVTSGVCAAALLVGIHNSDQVSANSTTQLNFETIYHVYVYSERIGTVDNRAIIDRVVEEKVKQYEQHYEDVNFVIGDELQIIREVVFNSRANNENTIKQLEERLSVKAEAYALTVDDEVVGYVQTEEEFKEVIKQLKLQYVTEEELTNILQLKENNETATEPQIGETIITDIKLSKDVDNKVTAINVEKILTVEEAVKQLNLGTLEDDIYMVQSGDVLGSIAVAHGLSLQEILALNPTITENTLLQIGHELNVTVYEPIVKVIVEKTAKLKEEIPFQTDTRDDANLWRGDTKVTQAGQNGERVVNYNITRENGRTIERQIISETVTKQPVDRIVLRGTKVSPSRGTGSLSWPAVGGRVTSYMGMRWGSYHRGIDIAGVSNRNILAADNGTVAFAGWHNGGYGNKIIINHNNGMRTLYAHLASIDVRVGQTVGKGQKIGVMGSTGHSTGVHLHFEVYQNGQLRNPMDYFR